MIISDEMPSVTWSLLGQNASVWFAAAPLGRLTNGAPRIGTRLARSSGAGGFLLRAEWSLATRPRVFAMLGLGEEWAGEVVSLFGRSSTAASYSVTIDGALPVQRLPDGSLAVFAIIDPAILFDEINGVQVTSQGGGTGYTIGEVVIATAEEWAIRRDWTETVLTLTKENRTVTGQPFNVRRPQYRRATVTIAPQLWANSVSLDNVQTLQKLQARLSQNQPVLVFPALRPPGTGKLAPIVTDTAFAAALYGTCSSLGQISLVDGSNLADLQLSFTESPAGRIN